MSTSIDGYRFTSDVSAFEAARRLRTTLSEAVIEYDLRELMADAVLLVDDADTRGSDRPTDPIATVMRTFADQRRAGDRPGAGRCIVFLGDDPGDPLHRVHVVLNAPDEIQKAMGTIADLREFGYFTGSDWLPDGVSREQYATRAHAWDRVAPSGMFKRDMMQLHVRDPYDIDVFKVARERHEHREWLFELAPSVDERARSVTASVLWHAIYAAQVQENNPGRFFFGQPDHIRAAVAAALNASLIEALLTDGLDSEPVPDLTTAHELAARWVSDGMPEDEIDEAAADTERPAQENS